MRLPIIFALMTALFWGLYGPTLAQARFSLGKTTAFKPYIAIGIAYLVWGIVGGLVGVIVKNEGFSFNMTGMTWAFAAGSLGAFGALALTNAMVSGGHQRPQVVMAFVFGGAVTVSAIAGFVQNVMKGNTESSPWLWIGIVGIAVSAVLVAYNTPHGGPAKKGHSPTEHTGSAPAAESAQASSN